MTREELVTELQDVLDWAFRNGIELDGFGELYDEVTKLKQPPTLAEFLGWEENQEYHVEGIANFMIKNGVLEYRYRGVKNWEPYSARISESIFERLRTGKKIEEKKYRLVNRELECGYLTYSDADGVFFSGGKDDDDGFQSVFSLKEYEHLRRQYPKTVASCELVEVSR